MCKISDIFLFDSFTGLILIVVCEKCKYKCVYFQLNDWVVCYRVYVCAHFYLKKKKKVRKLLKYFISQVAVQGLKKK